MCPAPPALLLRFRLFLFLLLLLLLGALLLQSAIDTDKITVDPDTKEMLKALDFGSMRVDVQVAAQQEHRPPRKHQDKA